jgi:hypothetical protein
MVDPGGGFANYQGRLWRGTFSCMGPAKSCCYIWRFWRSLAVEAPGLRLYSPFYCPCLLWTT